MKRTEALKPQSAVTEIARRPLQTLSLVLVQQALVTRAFARVSEGLAFYVHKPPAVRAGAELKLEDTRGASLHYLHSRGLLYFTASRRAPGPYHELADAAVQIYFAPWG